MNSKRRKVGISLLVLGLAAVAAIGAIYAWNMHWVKQDNILSSHTTSVAIKENFPDKTITPGVTKTKQAAFENTGSSAVFLRIAVNESWENGAEWLADDGTQVTKNWTDVWRNDFVDGNDGWYYYKKVLPRGAATGNVLESVSFAAGVDSVYAEGVYSLDFIAEAVQLSDEATVNTSAVQTVFGKTATVTGMTTEDGAATSGTVNWN